MDILQLITDIIRIIERGFKIVETAFSMANGVNNSPEKAETSETDR